MCDTLVNIDKLKSHMDQLFNKSLCPIGIPSIPSSSSTSSTQLTPVGAPTVAAAGVQGSEVEGPPPDEFH